MDNLPGNPSNPNSGNNNPVPPFGSDFNPHINNPIPNGIRTNPVDPNNPYQTQPPPAPNSIPQPPIPVIPNTPNHSSSYSEVAQHKLRDSHGRFASDHTNPSSETLPKSESIFKRIITFIIKIKWTKLTLYITGAFTFIYLVVSNPAVQNIINQLFPNSSPILARSVSLQGTLRTSETGIYSLVLPDQQTYTLHFKPSSALTNLKRLNEVVVKGNLTWTPFVIENAEIYPLNISTP